MSNSTITFYPVGNGDCNLIELSDAVKMLVDCNFTLDAEKEDSDTFNVFNDLVSNKLATKFGLPFLDAFVLTHPDQDHCRGFASKFYLKDPHNTTPTKEEKDSHLMVIGELWYSPRIFSENTSALSDDAKAFKKEAKRRMMLWLEDDPNKNKDGNRIRIIGYFDNDDIAKLPDSVKSFPGHLVEKVNDKKLNTSRFFIHAPFKEELEGNDRNCTSIVFQLRIDAGSKKDVGKIIMGGDAEWRVWEKIQENTDDDNNLKWNIFEAPHHCSYTFFADDREDNPEQSSLDFLTRREGNGYIVSSSKLIKKNCDNPPCHKAKNRYIKAIGNDEDYFLCTTTKDANDKEVYTPVTFEIASGGVKEVVKRDTSATSKSVNQGITPHYYG